MDNVPGMCNSEIKAGDTLANGTSKDLTLTVVINTTYIAVENAGGGFATGDDSNIGLLMASTIGSLGLMIILFTISVINAIIILQDNSNYY